MDGWNQRSNGKKIEEGGEARLEHSAFLTPGVGSHNGLSNRPLTWIIPSFSSKEHSRHPTTLLKELNLVSWTPKSMAFLEVMPVAVVVVGWLVGGQ